MERYQHQGVRQLFRGDTAFAKPEIYEYLELQGIEYAIRMPANDILEQEIKHLLKRPDGELPEKPVIRYHNFQYQAKNWNRPRRVVIKVEWHRGELLPRVWLHRYQSALQSQGRSALLQRAGDSGAMDQGR